MSAQPHSSVPEIDSFAPPPATSIFPGWVVPGPPGALSAGRGGWAWEFELGGAAAEAFVFAVLAAALVLFLWGRWRYDIVALVALLAVGLAGVLPRDELFLGFGHPAVVTVAAVLVVSRGLANAGIVDALARLLAWTGGRVFLQAALLALITAVASAFMNNVGALALLMPVAIRLARKSGHRPSRVLMPIAFASLLGGLVTLVGTPPNIIIAQLRQGLEGDAFRMFDFTPVGGLVALAGLAFMLLGGLFLVPKREAKDTADLFHIDDYLTEVRVPPDADPVGRPLGELVKDGDVLVIRIVRGEHAVPVVGPTDIVMGGDVLVVEASAGAVGAWVERHGLELAATEGVEQRLREAGETTVLEAVVLPNATIAGRSAKIVRVRTRYSVNVLAVSRQGERTVERLGDLTFRAGDVVLLEGPAGVVEEAVSGLGLLPLAEREIAVRAPRRLLEGGAIFGAAVAASAVGVVAVEVAFVAAAVGMVLTGLIPLRQVYTSIDWPVIVLLGAMLPVGIALETTGGASRIAGLLLDVGTDLPMTATLGLLIGVTMLLSNVINNAAAAVLMAPVAASLASGLDASVDPFLMGVAVGASCAFLTPIGHQSNTLVMGPGGYRFSDYWRLGLPLSVLVMVAAVFLIPRFWPL